MSKTIHKHGLRGYGVVSRMKGLVLPLTVYAYERSPAQLVDHDGIVIANVKDAETAVALAEAANGNHPTNVEYMT